uniref:Uncharacterized protein n=1 Tax=Magallana gigas TaxID=29159 RepID=K1Q7F1_MAGGI
MFHFTARWQLLTGVPTVQSGQDNLEVLMSDRHQITEDSKETPTQHLTHNIYSIHGDFGEEGRRTYEDVHEFFKFYGNTICRGTNVLDKPGDIAK